MKMKMKKRECACGRISQWIWMRIQCAMRRSILRVCVYVIDYFDCDYIMFVVIDQSI